MATCTTEQFVGQGKVFVAPRASNGAINGGWTELGDTPRLEVSISQDFLDDYESCSGNRSITLHVPIQTDWEFSVDAKSFSKENLARAFYGTASAVSGATVTGEAPVGYALNQIIPLEHPNVSAVTVTKGVTPLVAGVDYTLDAKNGTITLISSTNLGGAGPWTLDVDYTYAAYEKVETNTQTISEYAFRFEGINLATKKSVIAKLHRVSLNMAETLSLIGNEVATFTMSGMMLADSTAGVGESQYMTIVKEV
jgi:hypothetical protein